MSAFLLPKISQVGHTKIAVTFFKLNQLTSKLLQIEANTYGFVLIIVNNLALGSRIEEGKIVETEEDRESDVQAGKTKQEVTMNVLQKVANSVMEFLQFTTEVS